ncbi:FG-GAP repeat domain-containing protein [Thalassoroseus pseudoceratinae]|uniref:FG-GAP repeat domain-containing protein n=1 Tax=Thalassoroseus pseudoceratinae TaxID=2713176 RepID=UPI0014228230|nr:VCBS repeat-containing protein [Thalassoroseus pseudoceratinae]
MRTPVRRSTMFVLWGLLLIVPMNVSSAEPWRRHTIDQSSRGADGVRLADVNEDGLPDISTGWEEGGTIRAYLNPGPQASRDQWPAVTVGNVRSPEDAVFCDLDADGNTDVVSCCEGGNRTVFFHWAPEPKEYLNEDAWKTDAVPCTVKQQMWMYCIPLQVDGRRGVDLIVGSKGTGAAIGWLESPEEPRNVSDWKYHQLSSAGWIMSLEVIDMDGDGDLDVLTSDRKGKRRGVRWLENPGHEAVRSGREWANHLIGGAKSEVLFLDLVDLNRDGLDDVLCSTRDNHLLYFERAGKSSDHWIVRTCPNPLGVVWGKSIAAADMDGDGNPELVHLCNTQRAPNSVAAAYGEIQRITESELVVDWQPICEPRAYKFDRSELIDLDGDGDLDVLTCEERANLGVIWYENPGLTSPTR